MANGFENTKPTCSCSQESLIIPHCPAAFLPLKLGSSLFLEEVDAAWIKEPWLGFQDPKESLF